MQTNDESIILGTVNTVNKMKLSAGTPAGSAEPVGRRAVAWCRAPRLEPTHLLVTCQTGVITGLPLAFILRLNESIGVKPLNGCRAVALLKLYYCNFEAKKCPFPALLDLFFSNCRDLINM